MSLMIYFKCSELTQEISFDKCFMMITNDSSIKFSSLETAPLQYLIKSFLYNASLNKILMVPNTFINVCSLFKT